MTDDELAEELSAALRTVAEAYEPSDYSPTETSPRRRGLPIVLAAAMLALLAGLGAILWNGVDDAADLDIRNDPPSTPAPTSTSAPDGRADSWSGWTWTLGTAAPVETRIGHEVAWIGGEAAIWGGDQGPDVQGRGAAAYDPSSDTWRELSSVEVAAAERLRDDPAVAIATGVEAPQPHEALDGILHGTIDATPFAEGGPARWTLTGDSGGVVVLPSGPDPLGFGLAGARAVWTGDALVVWGGIYDCGPGAACAQFGPSEPFVLRPPDQPTGAPATVDPPLGNGEPINLSSYVDITWVLYSIEVDGELVGDDEPGTIAFELNPTGEEPLPLPLTATGWAGCDFTASLASHRDGDLGWSAAPDECGSSASSFSSLFIQRLAETEQANLLALWPTEFLELLGPGLRILLVPAPDNTVVGPFVPPTTAPPTNTTTAPPQAPEPPSGTTTSLADIVDAVWILHSLEIDGSPVSNDEPNDITLEMAVNGLPNLDSAELGISGQAGCAYSTSVRVESVTEIGASEPGALTWHAPAGDCAGASTLATEYLARLADTTTTVLLELSPTPLLELTGAAVRFRFAPVPIAPTPPATIPTPLAPPSEPIVTGSESSPGLAWTLDAAPYGDLAGWSFVLGEEIVTIADDPDSGSSALVGHGFNTVSGLWRVLPSQPLLSSEVLQATVWTGGSIAAYTQGGGHAQLAEYDPATDQWRYISGWEFFDSRYKTLLMEMRAGEVYIEGEASGARWHIKQREGLLGTYDRIEP